MVVVAAAAAASVVVVVVVVVVVITMTVRTCITVDNSSLLGCDAVSYGG